MILRLPPPGELPVPRLERGKALLQGESDEHAKEEASSALWSLSANHYENQVAIADAGGVPALVGVLRVAR